jgi:hypothetical protein
VNKEFKALSAPPAHRANKAFRVKWVPRAYKVGWGRQALGATRAIRVYKVSKEKSVRPVLRVNRVSKVK